MFLEVPVGQQEDFIAAVAEAVNQYNNQNGSCDPFMGSANAACQNVLWSPVSTQRFYRSCRTNIDVIESGALPLAPGSSLVVKQAPHPGWLGGCFMITYRLANGGVNHGDIKFEWFLDTELLDGELWGSEIYDNANHLVGDGMHPLPMHCGVQCCIGGLNTLKLKVSHTGGVNQLEALRVFVQHGVKACCNACGSSRSCQVGCANKPHQQQQPLPQVPQPVPLQLPQGQGQNFQFFVQPGPNMKLMNGNG